MKQGLKGGISIAADSGPPRYVLWCCGGICHQLLTFFQIGCGHTVSTILMVKDLPLNNFDRPGCTIQDQGNLFGKLHWSGYIKTWTSWIYLLIIKHPIFGFIYQLDGQRCSLKLKRSGYSKTWMSYIYICPLNSIKHHIFCFIYHLDGRRDTIKTVSDRPVCINTYMPWLYAFSCTMPEMRMHFW